MKQVTFKSAFKDISVSLLLSQRSAGREFHTDGPTTEKARSLNLVLVIWTTYLNKNNGVKS